MSDGTLPKGEFKKNERGFYREAVPHFYASLESQFSGSGGT